ncbi:hypothetical protein [Cecembia calidifontis]|jgi:hypothetical protein|uniref:Small multi-drug export protein n=1 Tax=Cecembia calidifontis TaxID=1187080 RepID=A0A4Q7P7A0_9BACT|nr:hypothetical protein [Cecembia calidifontis]RZS96006.1 hypothetical protein BC751_1560 [Cecembia calidifontis]
MIPYILKFLAIWFASLFKFIAGPVLGAAANYSLLEIIAVTVSGMMTSVLLVTFLGEWFKSHWNFRLTSKRFSKKSRAIVKTWKKFGPIGIASITPLLLTPIGGTIILTAFNVAKRKIFTYMLVSALIWSTILGASIHWFLSIPFFEFLLR